jgi:hypothetical protein
MASLGLYRLPEKGLLVSKKMLLLALAVAALSVPPSAASAQELHFSGATAFGGAGGVSSLTVSGEPKFSCTANTSSGSFDSGSSTTGTIEFVFTGHSRAVRISLRSAPCGKAPSNVHNPLT